MENSWTPTTKRIVVVGSVIALFVLISRFSAILPPLIITLILAYILSPIADFLSARLRLNRTLVVVIIYLVLIASIITLPAVFIPPLIVQIENLIEGLPDIIRSIGEFIEQPLIFGDFSLDLREVYEQTSSSLQSIVSSVGTQTISILSDIASALFWTFFILVASFYLVKDSAVIMRWLEEATPPAYRQDVNLLKRKIASSWNSFLRGQLILCLVMGLVVGITMALIGLPYAWLIGLLFGILEFIPNLGPTIASVPTVLIAFFKGSTVLNISSGWFAVLVIGINFLLQQLENNFLVPRIMGQSLNLHPLVVLIAAIIGAHTAGVLGILLAAPIVATLRVLAEYTYYRLLDMPPFPEQRTRISSDTAQASQEDKQRAYQMQPDAVQADGQPAHQIQPTVATEGEQGE